MIFSQEKVVKDKSPFVPGINDNCIFYAVDLITNTEKDWRAILLTFHKVDENKNIIGAPAEHKLFELNREKSYASAQNYPRTFLYDRKVNMGNEIRSFKEGETIPPDVSYRLEELKFEQFVSNLIAASCPDFFKNRNSIAVDSFEQVFELLSEVCAMSQQHPPFEIKMLFNYKGYLNIAEGENTQQFGHGLTLSKYEESKTIRPVSKDEDTSEGKATEAADGAVAEDLDLPF